MSTPFDRPGWSPADFLRAAMAGMTGTGGRRHEHGHSQPPEPPEPPQPPPPPHHGGRGGPGFGFGHGFPFGPGGGPGRFGFPPFGDPRQWAGWDGRGQRARRGDVRVAALALLAERPMNGYQLIQEIRQRSGGRWTPSSGSVYPALQQLEDEGLIEAGEVDGRRAFSLTAAGRRHVEEHADELRAPWESTADGMADDAAGMRETFGRAVVAFMQVWHTGTEEQREQAAKVIDDARRALYRILAEDDR